MIISERGNITIGNEIWNFVDNLTDTHILNIVVDNKRVASIDEEGNIYSPTIIKLEERIKRLEEIINNL
jgi:hypothetical protein